VSHRRAPRPGGEAFRAARDAAAPRTDLAAAEAVWRDAVGERVAAAAAPASMSAGTLTVECIDGVWAQELDLMQAALLERLREALGERAPRSLRMRVNEARFQ
jgi:predicted nucleic acid-binding Zn ribbon protein